MTDKDTWDALGFVTASKYREGVLRQLAADGAQTPTTLSDETGFGMPHVSRCLSELRDEDLVELLVPESRRKGRYYGATEYGEEIVGTVTDGVQS